MEMHGLTRHRHDRPVRGRYQRCAMPCGQRSHHSDRNRQASSPGCRSGEGMSAFVPWPEKSSNSYHQSLDVLLESLIVEALECLSVVELVGERVAGAVVLAEDVEPQLIGPPVAVLAVVSAGLPWYGSMLCRCSPTFWPPPPVLAKRTGHFVGACSSMLPMLFVDDGELK